MHNQLSFSNFKDSEFDDLAELLCQVFRTTPAELKHLYHSIIDDFDQDGWPPHSTGRDCFRSEDPGFCKLYDESPAIGVDLPSLFELNNPITDKPTIVILGQDPKAHQPSQSVGVGTPYGLHHKGSRETLTSTKLYFDMVCVLLELNCKVYLTDIYKIWVCDPQKPDHGAKLPKGDRQKFLAILKAELLMVNPTAIITWGRKSANSIAQMRLDIPHLEFLHPSGAANRAWKKLMNQSPSHDNKLAYWQSSVSASLSKIL